MRKQAIRTLAALMLCVTMVTPSIAEVMTFPGGIKIIGKEAFYGDESLDQAVLPNGVERIERKAFANSGLTEINLPRSLKYIAGNALDPGVRVTAEKNTYAYNWAVEEGFIKEEDSDFFTGVTAYSSTEILVYSELPEGWWINRVLASQTGNIEDAEEHGFEAFMPDGIYDEDRPLISGGYRPGTYYIWMQVNDEDGNILTSEPHKVTLHNEENQAPAAPSVAFRYEKYGDDVMCILEWSPVANATSYCVYYEPKASEGYHYYLCGSNNVYGGKYQISTYLDNYRFGVIGDRYYISAINGAGESPKAGPYTVTDHSNQNGISATFTTHELTIHPGESVPLPGEIKASAGYVDGVYVTVRAYSSEHPGYYADTMYSYGHYASYKFNSMTLNNFKLQKKNALAKAGTYTVCVWGSATACATKLLDTLTVHVEGTSTALSGSVKTEASAPLKNVTVTAVNKDDENDVRIAYTDDLGQWSMEVDRNASYWVNYAHPGYEFGGTYYCEGGEVLTAIGKLDGDPEEDDRIQVTLGSNTIWVGEAMSAEVTAIGATAVRLVVDGISYDEYAVTDNHVHVERIINKGGERRVQFQAMIDGDWSIISAAKTLTVNAKDQLTKPQFSVECSGYTGDSVKLHITTVTNATAYMIRIVQGENNNLLYQKKISAAELATGNGTAEIEKDVFLTEGTYCASVIATGNQYSQNDAQVYFSIQPREYTVGLTLIDPPAGNEYAPGETVRVRLTQTGGGYAGIKVMNGSDEPRYYPADGNHLTTAMNGEYEITPDQAGEYSVIASVYAIDTPPEANTAQATCEMIQFSVTGPAITRSIQVGQATGNYTWIDDKNANKAYVYVNSVVGKVKVTENGVETSRTRANGENPVPVDLPSTTAGYHKITVSATANESGGEAASLDKEFYYVITQNTPYTVYPVEAGLILKSSPIKGQDVTEVQGGEWIEPLKVIALGDDWIRVETINGKKGFIKASKTTTQIPAQANGQVEILSPVAGEKLNCDPATPAAIIWRSGVAGIEWASAKLYDIDNKTTQMVTMQGLYTSSLDLSDVTPGNYRLSVVVSYRDASGKQAMKESAGVECQIGDFNQVTVDEKTYKDWFFKTIYTPYSFYMDRFHNRIKGNSVSTMEACDSIHGLLSGGYVFNGCPIPLFSNTTVTTYTDLDEDERKKIDLIVVGDMVKDDAEKRYIAVKGDMTNINDLIMQKTEAGISEARIQANFDLFSAGAEAIKLTLKTKSAMKKAKLIQDDSKALEIWKKFQDKFDDWVDMIYDSAGIVVLDLAKQYDAVLICDAYKKEYTSSVRTASSIYIDALETTIFGGVGMSSKKAEKNMDRLEISAKRYIDACRRFQALDDSTLEQYAADELLEYSEGKYTPDIIDQYGDDFWGFVIDYISNGENWTPIITNLIQTIIKLKCEKSMKILIKEYTNLDDKAAGTVLNQDVPKVLEVLIKYDPNASFPLQLDFDAAVNTLLNRLKIRGVTIASETCVLLLVAMLSKLADSPALTKLQDNEIVKKLMKSKMTIDKSVLGPVTSVVASVGSSAWKLGAKIDKSIMSAMELKAQMRGKTAFETYAGYLSDTYAYNLRFASIHGLINTASTTYEWNQLQGKTIKELETMRQAMITFANSDEILLDYLLSMRNFNDKGGWKFVLKKEINGSDVTFGQADYPSEQAIRSEMSTIREYRENLMNVPAEIKTIINGAK